MPSSLLVVKLLKYSNDLNHCELIVSSHALKPDILGESLCDYKIALMISTS